MRHQLHVQSSICHVWPFPLVSFSGYTLGELHHQRHFELMPCSASKSLFHFLGQTLGLCSTFPCVLCQDTQVLSRPRLGFRRISWVLAPLFSITTLFSYGKNPLVLVSTSSSWWGRRGHDGSLQAGEEWCGTLCFLADQLGIQLHPGLLPGPLVGHHSSVCKLGVLPELLWKKYFFSLKQNKISALLLISPLLSLQD